MTPGELLSLIEGRELSNGFANRFLTIFSERSRVLAFPQATPQDQVDSLAQQLAEVLRFAGADRWVDRDQMRMSLSPSAMKLYGDLYVGELNRHDYGPRVTGLLERRAPVLLRIAMLLALTDRTTVIDCQHIEAALAWVRYWVDSVRFIFSSAMEEESQHAVTVAATKIVEYLATRGRQSRTKITTECFQGKLSKDHIDRALDELLQATPPAIVVEVERRIDGPGSSTRFYRLAAMSAKSAKSVDSRGVAHDSQPAEVGEVSEVRSEPPHTVRSVRTDRQTVIPAETRATIDDSLTSLSSPADDVEVFE